MEKLFILITICITILIISFMFYKSNTQTVNTTIIKRYDIKNHIKNCKWDHFNIVLMSDGSYKLEYYDDDFGY